MKLVDGSNTITRIILAAIMLITLGGGVMHMIWGVASVPEKFGGALVVVLVEAAGVWMWRRMPVIGAKS